MTAVVNTLATAHGGLYSKNSVVKFDRPANTTSYTAGDVISSTTGGDERAIQFKNVGKSGRIDHAIVVMEETDTVSLELWVFDSEPTNADDNAAIALDADDAEKLIAVYTFGDGAKKDGGAIEVYMATLDVEGTNIHRYATVSGSLWGLLVTRSVYTPLSASQFVVILQVKAD